MDGGVPDVRALNGHSDAANYRGEGEPDITIDVATAPSYHDLIRLAVFDDRNRIDECPLLDPDAATALATKLMDAVRHVRNRRPASPTEDSP
jgi:hypothetical protein